MKQLENAIQKEIVKWLQDQHIPVWRISETQNLTGFPDLLAIDPRNGKFVGIEVKTETGRVSAVQEVVHKMISKSRGIIIVARCVGDVQWYFADDGPVWVPM